MLEKSAQRKGDSMKKHIVCLGDSNTHGYCADPQDCADGGMRFNESERWTCLLQGALGPDYLVAEEGLNGRTTVFPDPVEEGKAAIDYIYPCLKSHQDVDLLIIMLGTNDAKERFSVSAFNIAAGMDRLVKKAMDTECWAGGSPNILVISPPAILEGVEQGPLRGTMGQGSVEKSRRLAAEYRLICEARGVHFLEADAIGCEFNTVDCMHLTRKGHATLAAALAELVPELLKQ